MKRLPAITFTLLWFFISFVEVYDIYLSLKYQDTLYENELNPIGKFLIDLDGGDVALFMTAKVAGIIMLITAIPLLLFFKKKRLAWTFLLLAFTSKLAVLCFLEFGHLLKIGFP